MANNCKLARAENELAAASRQLEKIQNRVSMIGNTVEVNNSHYTYDISKMDEKREFVKKAHSKRAYA